MKRPARHTERPLTDAERRLVEVFARIAYRRWRRRQAEQPRGRQLPPKRSSE